MDLKNIAQRLAETAEVLLPLIGGPKAAVAVEIAKGLLDLGKTVGDVLDADDAAPLNAALPALQARVTAYANETAAGLRGE